MKLAFVKAVRTLEYRSLSRRFGNIIKKSDYYSSKVFEDRKLLTIYNYYNLKLNT